MLFGLKRDGQDLKGGGSMSHQPASFQKAAFCHKIVCLIVCPKIDICSTFEVPYWSQDIDAFCVDYTKCLATLWHKQI